MDPIDDSTFKNIWMATAKVRENINVFSCHSQFNPSHLYHSKLLMLLFLECRNRFGMSNLVLHIMLGCCFLQL